MRTGWLLLVVAAAGCAHRTWHVSVPAQIASIPTDAFYSFPVMNVAGGIKPGPIQTFSASCADPAICEARVIPPSAPGEFGEIQVIGKQIGSTTVVVDADNPVYQDHERHTIAVMVTAPPARSTIVLDAPTPAGTDLVDRFAGADIGHCTPSTGAFDQHVNGTDRADVHLYMCSSYVEGRYRTCGEGLCSAADSYLLCTQSRSGTVAATAVLTSAATGFEVTGSEGTFDPDVCTPRR